MSLVGFEPANQQASDRRPTLQTSQPAGLAIFLFIQEKKRQKCGSHVIRSGMYDKLPAEIIFVINILIHVLYSFLNYHYTRGTLTLKKKKKKKKKGLAKKKISQQMRAGTAS
jgi:hypothetical protein